MAFLSNAVIDLVDAALGSGTAARTGAAFFDKLRPFGAKAIYARAFGLPGEAPFEEQVFSRISPSGWESLYAEKQFATVNYLPRESRRRSSPFAWSEIRLQTKAEQNLMTTLRDCGFPDGLAMPCHGPNGYLGVVSLAFERLHAIGPDDRRAIEIASIVMHDRMRDLSLPPEACRPELTGRELECLRFVADGRLDGEIADLLSLSESTVISHIKSARSKLGARTRAQAVARCFLNGSL